MVDRVTLRDYRASDLDAIFQLDVLCFPEPFRFDRASMRRFAERRKAITLIAEDEGEEICGFVIVQLERNRSELLAYVVTLDVAPAFRRSGVAARLMQEAERRAGVAGACRVELHVFSGNEGAVRFYERLEYERIGEQPGFYGRVGLDALVYRKALDYL
jgi:ribosomal-protein-alanine N-acetyltransferase